jgi:hypothetical protein
MLSRSSGNRACTLTSLALGLLVSPGSAEFPTSPLYPTSNARSQSDEALTFRNLFNGKDLSGWISPDDASLFRVEAGEIIGQTREGQLKKNEFLVTAQTFSNFVLKARVKIESGNSGIQIRSTRRDNGAVAGPQIDIADEYWGVLYDEGGSRGIIERFDPDKIRSIARVGDWNDLLIRVEGDRLQVTFNGIRIIDRKDSLFPHEGVIGLQVHAGPPMTVRFKELQIAELGPKS